MAFRIGSAFIQLTLVGTTAVISGFRAIGAAALTVGRTIATAFATIAVVAALALVVATKKVIAAAGIQEQAEARLRGVLKATAGAAGLTADELFKEAAALQKVTKFGDEVIINSQAIIATFKGIKGKEFKEVTELVLDLATVMGTAPKAAALQLAKALNEPKKRLSELSRAGVTFSEGEIQVINALVDAGKAAEAQSKILAVLRAQFGGIARAEAATFSGRLTQISNRFGDIAETIGFLVQPELEGLVDGFDDLGTAIEGNGKIMQIFIAVIADGLSLLVNLIKVVSLSIIKFGVDVTNVLENLFEGNFDFRQSAFSKALDDQITEASLRVGDIFKTFGERDPKARAERAARGVAGPEEIAAEKRKSKKSVSGSFITDPAGLFKSIQQKLIPQDPIQKKQLDALLNINQESKKQTKKLFDVADSLRDLVNQPSTFG